MAKDKLIQIRDRVNRMDKIVWSEMLSIRNDDLKSHTEAQLEKLEQSLIHNGFIEPFAAWQDPKTKEIYTINGHTRKKRLLALIDKGYAIPEKLSAFFIDCKNLNDAASVLPLYESKYGNIDTNKLDEFKITFELDEKKVKGSDYDEYFLPNDAEPNVDYSILNSMNGQGIEGEMNQASLNVKKAIQIEFEIEHYEEAFEVVKFWREKDAYVGKMIIDFLKSEKNKL